jgi:hypothetical protein
MKQKREVHTGRYVGVYVWTSAIVVQFWGAKQVMRKMLFFGVCTVHTIFDEQLQRLSRA